MKKSRFIFAILIVFLFSFISFAFADENKAFDCLKDKIDSKTCEKLSAEEMAFSYLTVSKCKNEIISNSLNDECWPKSGCDVKSTAQSIIAWNKASYDTTDAIEWLLTQLSNPKELEWYLQIESSEPTTCKITYDSKEYVINIDERKINSNAGSCLILAQGGYWLEVKPGCYDTSFKISCDESFSTSLIYKKKTSSEFFIPEKSNSASAQGSTTEKLNSFCFKKGTLCDYESTLWAAIALQSSGKDISSFKPYLISMTEENSKYIPESFLYKLTESDEFKEQLILEQNTKGYWDESGDKFYDTAIALYSLQSETLQEKSDALSWLLEVQDSDGCWGGIKETAFLLHAGWQKPTSVIVDEPEPIEEEEEEKEIEEDEDEEEEKNKTQEDDEKTNYWPFIIILSILIFLAILGIIFRDKLRYFWFRMKSKFGRGTSSSSGPTPPGFLPPGTPQQQDIKPRRILPPQSRRTYAPRKPKPVHDKEFSEVLKKLKEMGS